MADTFHRATKQKELSEELRSFANDFQKKFRDIQLKEQK
jgi:hypothetical protein